MANFDTFYARARMIGIALAVLSLGTAIAVIGFILTQK